MNRARKFKFSKRYLEYFKNPKNLGEMKNPDGVGDVGNPICSDVTTVQIKVKKDPKTGKKIISNIKFQTMGCAAAIASAAMTTELAKGKTLDEAMKITVKDVDKGLGGLPPVKMHCCSMAALALHEAIKDYRKKKTKKK